MNSIQAKQLSLPDIMARLGFEPTQVQKGGEELWYKSPFRDEKDASFHTSFLGGKWIWNDFGDDGGTVIDFVMRLKNYRQVSEALDFLEKMYRGKSWNLAAKPTPSVASESDLFSSQQQEFFKPYQAASGDLEFVEAHEIRSSVISLYLTRQRAIPKRLVDLYLKEIKYRNRGKDFFAFGMENASGGFEIRAASDEYKFKSALIKRDITFIKGTSPEKKAVNVFEGMTDFLSLLAMYNSEQMAGDAIIMHSLSSFPRTVEFIRSHDYATVNTFLDNDRAGQECTERFKTELGEKAVSQSAIFAPHEDLNDALKAHRVPDSFYR